jgi:alpha-1,6-mannosyltransferase
MPVIRLGAFWSGLFSQGLQRWRTSPMFLLIGLGIASLAIYAAAYLHGPFRPGRITAFFGLFGAAFVLSMLATWLILRPAQPSRRLLIVIFIFAGLMNLALLPSKASLSDDMYRYVWDGRVQGNGINPYRFPSSAPELAELRDLAIWGNMNRIGATTIYPPGAQLVFAALWRIVGNSVMGFKLFMVLCVFGCGWLLARLLHHFGERPERVLIFLWSPLVIFEIAESGHVDALYLPLIVGAMLVRAVAPTDRVSTKHEALIGFLFGAATLTKLYPAMMLAPLWSVRDANGRRRWRFILPITMLATVVVGYLLYIAPGVDTLGFLPRYTREFFNIGPLPLTLINWATANHIDFWKPTALLMPALVALVSLWFVISPARTAREAVTRCMWPISIYLLVNQNLFSWYVLWMLPLITLDLKSGRWLGFQLNTALAWSLFSGLVALSYTLFITGWVQQWAIDAQFIPLYALFGLIGLNKVIRTVASISTKEPVKELA